MMKIFKILQKRTWIIALLIFLLAFSLRLIAALKIAWRPDEIVYVDWLGGWFKEHFWDYLFQFYHKLYPPRSDVFGSPPLAMWLMTLGIWLAQKFNFSVLLGARLINVFIGSLTAVYLFYFGRRWFSFRAGLFAALAFCLIPVVITNNSTAYLDTLLALFVLLTVDLTYRYGQYHHRFHLFLLGIVLGLSILTKLVVVPVILLVWLVIYLSFKKGESKKNYLIFIAVTVLTPIILWSGFRDPQHIAGLFRVYETGIYNPYPATYPTPIFLYLYIMLVGVLPPIIALAGLYKIFTLMRNIIRHGWQQSWPLVLIVGLIIAFITYNSIFARYTTTHQLVSISPLILILAGLGFEKILDLFSQKWLKQGLIVGLVISLILPLISFKPQFWGLYGSLLVGGSNNGYKLYSAGSDGEEVPETASFLKENTPANSRIAGINNDWLFPKYLEERSFAPIFLTEGLEGAYARGAEYVVIPRVYLEVQSKTLREFDKLEPIYTLFEKGVLLAKVYQVDYEKIKLSQEFNLGSGGDWQVQGRFNNPEFRLEENQLKIGYQFTKEFALRETGDSRVLLVSRQTLQPREAEGLYLEAFGDGNKKTLSIILIGEYQDILTYETTFDWQGWKKLYVPFNFFRASSKPNFEQNYSLSIGFYSRETISGEAIFRNIATANLEK